MGKTSEEVTSWFHLRVVVGGVDRLQVCRGGRAARTCWWKGVEWEGNGGIQDDSASWLQ